LFRGWGSQADEAQSEPELEAVPFWAESAGRPSWQAVPQRLKQREKGIDEMCAGVRSHAQSEPCTPRSLSDLRTAQQLQIPSFSKKPVRPLGTTKKLFSFSGGAEAAMEARGTFDSHAEQVGRSVFEGSAGVRSWNESPPRNKRALHLQELSAQESAPVIGVSENRFAEPLNQTFDGAAGQKTWIERRKPRKLASTQSACCIWNDSTQADAAIHYGSDVERVFPTDGFAGMATWEADRGKEKRTLKKQYPSAPVRKACVDTLVFNKSQDVSESGGWQSARGETPRNVGVEKYYALFGDRAGLRTWYRSLEDQGESRGVKQVQCSKVDVDDLVSPRIEQQPAPPPRLTPREGGNAPWERDFSTKPWLHMRPGHQAAITTEEPAAGHRQDREEDPGRRKARAKDLSEGRPAGLPRNDIAAAFTKDKRLADGGPLVLA